jgi:hypothetical protein
VSETASGYARALAALRADGVEFVLVGVGGINFYARTPAQAFATLDLDAFIAPTAINLRKALSALYRIGFAFEAGGEPFLDIEDDLVLRRVVETGGHLIAIHSDGTELDLLTSISGFDYASLAGDSATFEVSGTSIRVGRLEKLLRSKEVAGRPKDVEFLRAFRARSEEPD